MLGKLRKMIYIYIRIIGREINFWHGDLIIFVNDF